MSLSKTKKSFNSSIYPLFFSGIIYKGTYEKKRKELKHKERHIKDSKGNSKITSTYQPCLDLHQSSSQSYNSRAVQIEWR
jgi:hypothetical protein